MGLINIFNNIRNRIKKIFKNKIKNTVKHSKMGLTRDELAEKASQNAKNLQVQEIEDLADAWQKLDQNGDETILVSEVDQFLQDLKIKMPEDARDALIADLDKNGNGTISFIEFVIAYNNGVFSEFKFE